MSSSDFETGDAPLRARLRLLASRPVDVSSLDEWLLRELANGVQNRAAGGPTKRSWQVNWRTTATAAASLVVLVSVLLVFFVPGRTVHAEPAAMARLHADIVAGSVPMTRVATVAEAAALVRRDWPDAPELPALPVEHELACCLKDFEGRRVVCLVFENEGVPISVVIASGRSLRPAAPPSAAAVHGVDGVNMVMKERDGRFVCVMGNVPASRLLQLLEAFEF